MAERTGIEWCDHTWNPWLGCTKVSPGCDHCYAESWAKRTGHAELWQDKRRRTTESYWLLPLKWDRIAKASGMSVRVFPSLCDPFDNQAEAWWRTDFWLLIRRTPYLTWLLLTKRPQNIPKTLPPDWGAGWPNVWLGTTAEDASHYRRCWAQLAAVPAWLRFLSYEPALGPIDDLDLGRVGAPEWVICGGESGPHARPIHPDWARSVRDQCAAAGVPFFFKQWGEFLTGEDSDGAGIDDVCFQDGTAFCVVDDHTDIVLDIARTTKGAVKHINREYWASGDGKLLKRIGKRRAGALLDGREHREFPQE